MLTVGGDMVHHTVDLEVGNHFIDVVWHHQYVGLAGQFIDVVALFRNVPF
jgi:hypothetical protein